MGIGTIVSNTAQVVDPATRAAIGTLETFTIVAVTMYELHRRRVMEGKELPMYLREEIDMFQRITSIYIVFASVSVIPIVLNAALPLSVCNVMEWIVIPLYAAMKYIYYRTIYSKAILYDALREVKTVTAGARVMVFRVNPVLLTIWTVTFLFGFQPETKDGKCYRVDKWNHDVSYVIQAVMTTADGVTSLLCLIILLVPVFVPCFSEEAQSPSILASAIQQSIGGFLALMSSFILQTTLGASIDLQGAYATRWLCDLFLGDLTLNYALIMVAFGKFLGCLCPCGRRRRNPRNFASRGCISPHPPPQGPGGEVKDTGSAVDEAHGADNDVDVEVEDVQMKARQFHCTREEDDCAEDAGFSPSHHGIPTSAVGNAPQRNRHDQRPSSQTGASGTSSIPRSHQRASLTRGNQAIESIATLPDTMGTPIAVTRSVARPPNSRNSLMQPVLLKSTTPSAGTRG